MRVSCFGVFVARQVCLVFEEGDSWDLCFLSRKSEGGDLLNGQQTRCLFN